MIPHLRLLLVSMAAAAAFGGVPPSAVDPVEEARIQELAKASGVPSVSIAVVENGELSYARAFGVADIAAGRPADPSTRYFVGSVSKQFTSAAILLAAEEGKLSLDDRVSRFYPELTRARDITIRELLGHVSGYEDFAPQDYFVPAWAHPIAPDAIIKAWAQKPLDFEPGTRWQYSNTNYVLAARIFERATGEELVPFLKRRIFGPLGMTSATDGYVERRPGDASPYTRYGLGPPRPATAEAPSWYYGAGELAMTPSDLARWDIALLQHRILSARSYAELTREVRLKNGDLTHYALGVGVREMDGIPRLAHTGEVSGFLTSNAVFPTRGAAVVVCTNQDSVFVFGTIASQLARWLLEPEGRVPDQAKPEELARVKAVVSALMLGSIDRSLFTPNANAYYGEVALQDLRASLAPLGAVNSVARTRSGKRGGMTFADYAVSLRNGGVNVSVYVTPEGLYEQFMVSQDI
jgi:CubicO group peptidase (beta-lactamase class C family)